jgi:hypothetical protein
VPLTAKEAADVADVETGSLDLPPLPTPASRASLITPPLGDDAALVRRVGFCLHI